MIRWCLSLVLFGLLSFFGQAQLIADENNQESLARVSQKFLKEGKLRQALVGFHYCTAEKVNTPLAKDCQVKVDSIRAILRQKDSVALLGRWVYAGYMRSFNFTRGYYKQKLAIHPDSIVFYEYVGKEYQILKTIIINNRRYNGATSGGFSFRDSEGTLWQMNVSPKKDMVSIFDNFSMHRSDDIYIREDLFEAYTK
ncbi:hypothetical protein [Sediminicola luteus]|uniref:Uncharacterized protein n=1 Tax=Sediminicola luteus TaxID=319238 RepID=A0A2A4GD93_9FLAO|nr:hypothetical protein [Sediminicola luteus]PCE65940.1 hypothetical protein B7P33_01160 [Sediminicola luteus]